MDPLSKSMNMGYRALDWAEYKEHWDLVLYLREYSGYFLCSFEFYFCEKRDLLFLFKFFALERNIFWREYYCVIFYKQKMVIFELLGALCW